ncbi:uridine kinase [uncultured Thiodictyon sp.]|uniref:uridine kinase n=1 Tax=uncultured Thiodictyon sp. TaxID=1846217 RepID=UPI0025DC03EE|nr:uridine kinase [uncultured Thiodictyon sp.]
MRTPTIIGIAGGSGSGKTTFAFMLRDWLGPARCSILHQDAYYRDQSDAFDCDGGSVNFDHPDAIDFDLLSGHLEELRGGRPIAVPVYDYHSHRRLRETHALAPCPVTIVEGLLILAHPLVRANCDTKVFIETAERVRFARRLARDTRERGRDPAGVEQQFLAQVKPMHDRFVEPSKEYADRVYSGEASMEPSIRDLIAAIGGVN